MIFLIALAVAFSASAILFHSVVAAGRKIEQQSMSVPNGSTELTPRDSGIPAVHDDVLF
jgi:hypothetical protein